MNDRLQDKLIRLERLVEEQRVQIVQLEANSRVTKAELNTPDKEFHTSTTIVCGSSESHKLSSTQEIPQAPIHRMTPQGIPQVLTQGLLQVPSIPTPLNDNGGTDCNALKGDGQTTELLDNPNHRSKRHWGKP